MNCTERLNLLVWICLMDSVNSFIEWFLGAVTEPTSTDSQTKDSIYWFESGFCKLIYWMIPQSGYWINIYWFTNNLLLSILVNQKLQWSVTCACWFTNKWFFCVCFWMNLKDYALYNWKWMIEWMNEYMKKYWLNLKDICIRIQKLCKNTILL